MFDLPVSKGMNSSSLDLKVKYELFQKLIISPKNRQKNDNLKDIGKPYIQGQEQLKAVPKRSTTVSQAFNPP